MAEMDLSSLSGLGEQALQMMDSGGDAPAGANLESAQVPPASPVATPSTPTVETTPPATSGQAEELLSFDFGNGRVEQLTKEQVRQKLKDAEAGSMLMKDYTQKTQALATSKRDVEAMAAELQRRAMILQQAQLQLQQGQNPQTVYQQPFAPQQQPVVPQPVLDPTAPMTVAQAAQLAQSFEQRLQMQEQQILQQARGAFEDRLEVANYSEQINNTLGEVFKEHPVLKVEPELEDVLRYRVAQTKPETVEQAQAAFRTIAKEMATKLGSVYAQQQQQREIQKANLTTGGIVPPGGAAPQPQAPSYKTPKGDLDWNKLREAALQIG